MDVTGLLHLHCGQQSHRGEYSNDMGGNIPGGNFLGGDFPGKNSPGGSLMGGSFPGGNFPRTIFQNVHTDFADNML